MHLFPKLAVAGLLSVALAHPGETHEHDEVAELSKREFKAHTRRGLANCAGKLQAPGGIMERAAARRAETVSKHREARGLEVRSTKSVLNTTHHSNQGYTPNTAEDIIFASNKTCILAPSGEVGPFWVKGEHLRYDLRDDEPGVPVILEGQFLNVETCEPIENIYWDIWNCNATGVYSGVSDLGSGSTDDKAILNKTSLRGVQKSDAHGVVSFHTVFPGHYAGRATHHHMIAHVNVTVLPNNTLSGGNVAHVAQLFYDQDLVNEVEATAPYSTNKVAITPNANDRVFATETGIDGEDPVIEYVRLGNNLSDGLFGWITFAVNMSASYDPGYSFVYTSSGSVAQSNGKGGGAGGGGFGGGNRPSGGGGGGGRPSGGFGGPSRGSQTGGGPTGAFPTGGFQTGGGRAGGAAPSAYTLTA